MNDRKKEERFMGRFEIVTESGCWIWMGARCNKGYGFFRDGEKSVRAHRFGYELMIGKIPLGLQLDHLCRVRCCVNPAHLEPVTQRVNILRGIGVAAMRAAQTHCKNGHPLTGDNLYLTPKGHRVCRICRREKVNNWQRARRALQEKAK